MYRALALIALREGGTSVLSDPDRLSELAESHEIVALDGVVTIDSEDVSGPIRSSGTGEAASLISSLKAVRRALVPQQRRAAASAASTGGVVAEGRDIGTVVFPDALLKVYIIADIACRAVRRLRDLESSGVEDPPTLRQVVGSLLVRDRRDRSRLDSPLRRAPDARLLDTTLMSIDRQVDEVERMLRERRAAIR